MKRKTLAAILFCAAPFILGAETTNTTNASEKIAEFEYESKTPGREGKQTYTIWKEGESVFITRPRGEPYRFLKIGDKWFYDANDNGIVDSYEMQQEWMRPEFNEKVLDVLDYLESKNEVKLLETQEYPQTPAELEKEPEFPEPMLPKEDKQSEKYLPKTPSEKDKKRVEEWRDIKEQIEKQKSDLTGRVKDYYPLPEPKLEEPEVYTKPVFDETGISKKELEELIEDFGKPFPSLMLGLRGGDNILGGSVGVRFGQKDIKFGIMAHGNYGFPQEIDRVKTDPMPTGRYFKGSVTNENMMSIGASGEIYFGPLLIGVGPNLWMYNQNTLESLLDKNGNVVKQNSNSTSNRKVSANIYTAVPIPIGKNKRIELGLVGGYDTFMGGYAEGRFVLNPKKK